MMEVMTTRHARAAPLMRMLCQAMGSNTTSIVHAVTVCRLSSYECAHLERRRFNAVEMLLLVAVPYVVIMPNMSLLDMQVF